MWTWSLNWGEVTPYILVGSCPRVPADLQRIVDQTGADAILSLQHDRCLARWDIDIADLKRAAKRLGVRLVRCPMRDADPADQRHTLPTATAALARLCAEQQRIYVHCTTGLYRSPLTVLAYLSLVEGRTFQEAIGLIEQVRPNAQPDWDVYHAFRRDLIRHHRQAFSSEPLDSLGDQPLDLTDDPLDDAHWHLAAASSLREKLLELGRDGGKKAGRNPIYS